jgi:acyl-CoA synthetase (NDP forming)
MTIRADGFAGRRLGSAGRAILLNIRDAGFAGRLFAVSPHGVAIEGIGCVPSVAALPEAPDLAVVTVSTARVIEVAGECGGPGRRHRRGCAYPGDQRTPRRPVPAPAPQ